MNDRRLIDYVVHSNGYTLITKLPSVVFMKIHNKFLKQREGGNMVMGESTTLTSIVTEILNSTLDAVTTVVSSPVQLGAPELLKGAIQQPEMGVLIGIAGDYPSRLVIEAKRDVYSSLAASMYGMTLEGEMLESFVGEIGNMVGGNMCTNMSEKGLLLEVTPPTVLVGETKLSGFQKALSVAGTVESVGDMRVSLLITEA